MDMCFLKETKNYKNYKLFFFLYFHINKILNSFWIHEGYLHIFYVPLFKKKRNYEKIIAYLKEKGIKKVCINHITDDFLIEKIKETFKVFEGEPLFYYYFEKIIDKFMKKNAFLYEESEIAFISDEPEQVKKYIEKVVKKFKKVSIFSKKKEHFINLAEECLKMYGTTLFLKDEKEQPKKQKRIYVNLENKTIFSKNFFKNVSIIDIFHIYENSFNEVLFKIPFSEELILKKEKISKNLCFLEYLSEKSKESLQTEYKIVNIKKI